MTRGAGRIVVVTMAILVVSAAAAPAFSAPVASARPARAWLSGRGHYVHRGAHGEVDVNVCSQTTPAGYAHCDAHVRTDLFDKGVRPHRQVPVRAGGVVNNAFVGNNGAYDPAFLQSAYDTPSATNGGGQTVAIVDAYDAPTVESDLAVYRSLFGIQPCTTANGCFKKIDQAGGTNYPKVNPQWQQEIELDVQMVSAICPNCHVLLVEATTNSMQNLGLAVNKAVALGANVVSNSYGTAEFANEAQFDTAYFNHPGVAITASSGDGGYGVLYPAASPDVVGVGGTSLVQMTNTGSRDASEFVWSGAGSGCSRYEPKPAWQTDSGCANRTVADVSAVADPNTGVWVYSTPDGGWEVFGGTSVAAPIIGSIYALAGNAPSSATLSSYPYAYASSFNDVLLGTNGNCGGTYLCTGAAGYDGPTGLGTPNGANAFAAGGLAVTPPPPPPDFSVGAAPLGAPLRPGRSATTTVTITPENGFTGTVALTSSLNGATGLTSTFSPASVVVGAGPATSTLILSAHAGGTYKLTITATQGAVVHTTSLNVRVNDFSIKAAPGKATALRGKQVRLSVKLTPAGSFAGPVTLSVAGLRAHQSVAFAHSPVPASGTQTVTISTSASDARGLQTLRIQGVSGSLNHSTTVVLTLQ